MGTFTQKSNIKAAQVRFTKDMLFVRLEDGHEIASPLGWFSKLRDASKIEPNNWRFI